MLDLASLSFLALPSLPPWEGAHVLVVHFPIALLLIAPVFVLLAMIFPVWARWASWAALLLLILGTVGAFLAVTTGQAASAAVQGSEEMLDTLALHESLGQWTRNVFIVLAAVYAPFVLLPIVFREFVTRQYLMPVNFVFLMVLGVASMLVANTAELGYKLVHQFGVKAVLSEPANKVDGQHAQQPEKKPVAPIAKPAQPEKKATPPATSAKPDAKDAKPETKPNVPKEKEAKPEAKSPEPAEKDNKPEAKSDKPPAK